MEFEPIGILHSPYKQKFAIPRQANLVPAVTAEIELFDDYSDLNCLRELNQFSHMWLVFQFHETTEQGWSPTVQPPRLGGQERVGVFASRSPFRPNPIGISAVQYIDHKRQNNKTTITVGGVDLLDKTPILDIKPYIPYADAISSATGGYADEKPEHKFKVSFSQDAAKQLADFQQQYPDLETLIIQVLTQDPRPAWRANEKDSKRYGMTLYELNIKWHLEGDRIEVLSLQTT